MSVIIVSPPASAMTDNRLMASLVSEDNPESVSLLQNHTGHRPHSSRKRMRNAKTHFSSLNDRGESSERQALLLPNSASFGDAEEDVMLGQRQTGQRQPDTGVHSNQRVAGSHMSPPATANASSSVDLASDVVDSWRYLTLQTQRVPARATRSTLLLASPSGSTLHLNPQSHRLLASSSTRSAPCRGRLNHARYLPVTRVNNIPTLPNNDYMDSSGNSSGSTYVTAASNTISRPGLARCTQSSSFDHHAHRSGPKTTADHHGHTPSHFKPTFRLLSFSAENLANLNNTGLLSYQNQATPARFRNQCFGDLVEFYDIATVGADYMRVNGALPNFTVLGRQSQRSNRSASPVEASCMPVTLDNGKRGHSNDPLVHIQPRISINNETYIESKTGLGNHDRSSVELRSAEEGLATEKRAVKHAPNQTGFAHHLSSGTGTQHQCMNLTYRLGRRKELFEKRSRAADYGIFFAILGIVLMIFETEMNNLEMYDKKQLFTEKPVSPRTEQCLHFPVHQQSPTIAMLAERLERRRAVFKRKRAAADYSLFFALLGIVLMIMENELTQAHIYEKSSVYSFAVKSLIAMSTIALLCFIVGYHALEIQLFLIDNSAEDWRIVLTARRVFQLLVELLICSVCPLPINYTFVWTTIHYDGQTVSSTAVSIDVLLSIPMFFRLYLIGRVMLLHSRLFTDASSRSIGALNRINFNTRFVMKTLMTLTPGTVLITFIASYWIIAAWIMRLCERHHTKQMDGSVIIQASMHRDYLNSIWLIAITFLSVGYGDIVPNTICGRTVSVVTGIMGAGTSSLVVAVLARKLELTRAEKHVHNFMRDTQLTKRLKHAAANVLRETWLIYKHRKLIQKIDAHRIRYHQRKFLMAIYELRRVRAGQRKLAENSHTIADIAKTSSTTYEIVSDIQEFEASIDNRIKTIESQIAQITNQIASLPDAIAQRFSSEGSGGGMSLRQRPSRDSAITIPGGE